MRLKTKLFGKPLGEEPRRMIGKEKKTRIEHNNDVIKEWYNAYLTGEIKRYEENLVILEANDGTRKRKQTTEGTGGTLACGGQALKTAHNRPTTKHGEARERVLGVDNDGITLL